MFLLIFGNSSRICIALFDMHCHVMTDIYRCCHCSRDEVGNRWREIALGCCVYVSRVIFRCIRTAVLQHMLSRVILFYSKTDSQFSTTLTLSNFHLYDRSNQIEVR